MSGDESLIAELTRAGEEQFGKIKGYLSDPGIDLTVLLVEAVRHVDICLISPPMPGRSKNEDYVYRLLTSYGYSSALALLLPLTKNNPGIGLTKSTNELKNWAAAFLCQLGAIKFLKRLLSSSRSGLIKMAKKTDSVSFHTVDGQVGVEIHELLELNRERADFAKVFKQSPPNPEKIDPAIQKKMNELVFEWKDDFIGYEAAPEIDEYFLRRSYADLANWGDLAGIHPNFRYKGLSGIDISAVALAMASLHRKHAGFCMEFLTKFPQKDPCNIFTIWDNKLTLTRTLAEWIGLSERVIDQCLGVLSATAENMQEHSKFITPVYPSLIEVTTNMWVRPVSGAVFNTLAFAAKELKRTDRAEWDRETAKRESWFRQDLYALFNGNRFARTADKRQLRDDTVLTDVDAAILDRLTGTLALIELKWQEPFGDDEAERRSRAKNLRGEITKWAGATKTFIGRNGLQGIAEQLDLEEADCAKVKRVVQFVLVRFHARFTGFSLNHTDALVVSWPRFRRNRIDNGSVDDTFNTLIESIKREEDTPMPGNPMPISFYVGRNKIVVDDLIRTFSAE